MDSHYNFRVGISYIYKDKETGRNSHEYKYLKFYPHNLLKEQKMDVFDKSIFHAQEFHDITLNFTAPADTIMQIPDLNDYDIQGMQIKKLGDGTYLHYYLPNHQIILFSDQNRIQTVPLSDDIYTVIVTQGKHRYFAYFRVVSKELKSDEWKTMVDDLAQISKKMITDNIHQFSHHLNLDDLRQADVLFQPLVNDYQKIMNYIHLILLNPRYKISKYYNWVKLGQEKDIDQITIKKMNEVPNTNGSIYVPHRYINYDIEDNRWIRFIAIQILRRTNLAVKHYQKIKRNNQSSFDNKKNHNFYHNDDSEIYHYKHHYNIVRIATENSLKKLLKLKGYLIYVLNNSMLSKLHRIKGFVPKGLILSAKYNALYRLYLNLKNNDTNKNLLNQQIKQYRYKPNSELYELWTVVQVIKALEYKNRYVGVKGWIFDNNAVMPPLHLGQKIFMKSTNSNIYLVVIYNETLPRHRVSRNNEDFNGGMTPIYINADHNKPDIRIDIFKNKNHFLGSIILDAKYMKLSHILDFHRTGSVRNQLFGYSRFSSTSPKLSWGQIPVVRVYALYPSNDDNKYYSQNYEMCDDMGVSLTRLRPGNKDNIINFANDINKKIDKRVRVVQKLLR